MAIAIEQIHVVRGFVYFTVQANFILFIIRIDRHKFIPCQELTLFRTEVKKKNAPVTISHTRISDLGELTPGQKPPHSFGTFEAQQLCRQIS